MKKTVIRLAMDVKAKMDRVAPPRKHMRSPFIRESLVSFLCKAKQALADRPHLRGRGKTYASICVILDQEQMESIKKVYPEVSESVVIQAAIVSELCEERYKIADLPKGNSTEPAKNADIKEQSTDDYPHTRGPTRELAAAFD